MAHMQEEPRRSQSAVEFNPVSLYQAGQDIVQDIAQKAQEIFQALKLSQLPNGIATGQRNAQERINKLKDLLNKVEVLFKQLRVIYNECQKRVGDVEPNVNTLVPILKEGEIPNTEHEQALKSHKELVNIKILYFKKITFFQTNYCFFTKFNNNIEDKKVVFNVLVCKTFLK
uniref:mediator of RNA polymerase II transcription subunit 30-like isoform X1 n=1 Tax=Ciona intestinalis TaxID=7719 RepID=UPI00089DAE88|nr:mediator of RNA polymerase II transcription subunit 30-like isoform X1 [Ciona intestinalis]|eukprot:XP_018668054.1 mediator of RNA polymerase II transcription subunit 30-like isoform X1 [Ciona intestinalis]